MTRAWRVLLPLCALLLCAQTSDDFFVGGDFAGAEQSYQATLATVPDDANALAGLARLRLYEEKRDEARDLARRALRADPHNTEARRVTAGAAARDVAFAPDVWRITMPDGAAEAPLVVTDPLPVVSVRIDGADHLFLISTGAPDIVLDSDFANELGLKPGGVQPGAYAGGGQAAFEQVMLPALDVAGVHVEAVPASVLPTRSMSSERTIDGIIGTGFLMHFLATIDYAEHVLILRPRNASATFEASVSEGQSVPMWLVGDHSLFARGRIGDGPDGLYSIDTGLEDTGLQATRATLDAAHVAIDDGAARPMSFTASATVGATTVEGLKGTVPDGDPYGLFTFAVAGTISHQFFRERTVSFDFDAMKMVTR